MNLRLELALWVNDGVKLKIQEEPCSIKVLNELTTVPTELVANLVKWCTWRSTERSLAELAVTRDLYFFEEGCYSKLTRNSRVHGIRHTVNHDGKVSCKDGVSTYCKSVQAN